MTGPAQDAYAAYSWVIGNAATFGGDPARVAVGGESAGSNLAAVTALLVRERGAPQPVHQLLVYPVADLVAAAEYPSARQYAEAQPLNTPALLWFGRYYLPAPAAGAEPTASPLRASSLAGLAPATVINAKIDPLRDQGPAYAAALRRVGVPAEQRTYGGVTHEFFGMGAVVDQARAALASAASALRASFAT